MKARYLIIASAMLMAACIREEPVVDTTGQELSFIAIQESSGEVSKTVVQDAGTQVYWEPGDEISVFYDRYSGRFTTSISEPSAVASFTGTIEGVTVPNDAELWALFPYSEDATCNMYSHVITTVIPDTQIARANSFGKDMNVTVAHSASGTFSFYNVGGGVRFSLSQSGVNKVILQSKGGESIAGKVSIDTSGDKPVITYINYGRSSITLLPPSGEEFLPDTWYYIVTIPGTLENGYSLCFCTSEKSGKYESSSSSTIKRGIFGSLERIDSRADAQGPVKKYPETEEEWNASLSLTNTIANDIYNYISNYSYSVEGEISAKDVIPYITSIEGVSRVYSTDNEECLVIIQNDDLHFNFLFKCPGNDKSLVAQTQSSFVSSSPRRKEEIITPNNKSIKALLLAPFRTASWRFWRQVWVDYDYINTTLKSVGCTLDAWENDYVSAELCTPYFLSEYDLIIFATHGGFHPVNLKGKKSQSTHLLLGKRIEKITYSKITKDIYGEEKNDLEKTWIIFKDGYFYESISAESLVAIENSSPNKEKASFNKTIVYAMACQSFLRHDLSDYFLNRGCSAYCGNYTKVLINDMNPGIMYFLDYLTKGASVRRSVEYASTIIDDFPMMSSPETNGPVYLIDSTPYNLDANIKDNHVTLSWEMAKTNGTYKMDVYWADGTLFQGDITSNSISFDEYTPGTYPWYVVAKLVDNGKIIDVFTSEVSSFTIEPIPEFVDLGLSVKWASHNLGAAEPHERGDSFAWGETSTKSSFTKECYKWYTSGIGYTKYGSVDGIKKLDDNDDAAYVYYDGAARMPTKQEITELCNSRKVDVHQATYRGMYGTMFVSKMDGFAGNWIFVPEHVTYSGTYFWSSEFGSGEMPIVFDSGFGGAHGYFNRYEGCYIRAVCPQ